MKHIVRRALRDLLICAGAVGIMALTIQPAPASADIANTLTGGVLGNVCGPEAPDPHSPQGDGASGAFTHVPNPIPSPQDPFNPGSTTTIFQQYGTAGLWWPTYDLGCGGSARDPGAVVWTDIANAWFDAATIPLVATDQLNSFAKSLPGMSQIDSAVASTTNSLRSFFVSSMSVAFGMLALWIISKARRGVLSEISTSVFWAGAILLLGTFAVSYPATAGRWFDGVSTGASQSVSSAFNQNKQGDDFVSEVNDQALYKLWLRGMFGSDDSQTAQTFGPKFYESMALSWSEEQTVQNDPSQGQKIIAAKKQQFTKLASQLHDQDPAAYGHMQGKDGGPYRFTLATLIAVPLTFTLCLFPALAALMVVLARLVGRLFIMGAPIIIPFGIMYRWSSPVQRLWGMVQSTFVNLIVFSVAGGAMAAVTSGLLQSGLPIAFVMVLVGLLTIAVFMATHPGKALMRQFGRAASFAAKAAVADAFVEHDLQPRVIHETSMTGPATAGAYPYQGAASGASTSANLPVFAHALNGPRPELQQALPSLSAGHQWYDTDGGNELRTYVPFRPPDGERTGSNAEIEPIPVNARALPSGIKSLGSGAESRNVIDLRDEPVYLPHSHNITRLNAGDT